MPWDLIRDVGLTIFIVGGLLRLAVSFARYLDPPQKDEKIRVLIDCWVYSIGDGLMIVGACFSLLGLGATFA
jgi:uncharacterized membrane protein